MDPADNKPSEKRQEGHADGRKLQQQKFFGGLGALGWQATCPTLRDRHAHLLMSETFADIFFLFRESNGTVHRIPAHKFVLSIGSSVFEAMFHRFNFPSSIDEGESSNGIRELELVDVEQGAFVALLTFLYTDDTQAINEDTALSILYTAKKYAMVALESACVSFLESCANSENAFMLLAKARFYDEKRLADYCLQIIDANADEALRSEHFLGIDHDSLCMVLGRNTLRVEELTLFNVAIRWTLEACRTRKLEPTPDNQRLVLGSALHQIRFPLMTPTDFAQQVVPSQLLSDSEVISVFLHHHNGPKLPLMPFSSSSRGPYTPEMVVKRFRRILSGWNYGDYQERIRFEVDTPVCILGFTLYGSEEVSCKYSAHIEVPFTSFLQQFHTIFSISDCNTGSLIAANTCSFLADGSPATFRVMFKEPVEICPNTAYVASTRIDGISSYYGEDGLSKVKVEHSGGGHDITWQFQDAPEIDDNDTSVEKGQIPEIIFCAKN